MQVTEYLKMIKCCCYIHIVLPPHLLSSITAAKHKIVQETLIYNHDKCDFHLSISLPNLEATLCFQVQLHLDDLCVFLMLHCIQCAHKSSGMSSSLWQQLSHYFVKCGVCWPTMKHKLCVVTSSILKISFSLGPALVCGVSGRTIFRQLRVYLRILWPKASIVVMHQSVTVPWLSVINNHYQN